MSMFLGKGAPTGPRKHMHRRLLQQRTEPSPAALSSPSVQPSGTVSSSSSTPATTPLVTPSTPVSTLTSSTPSLFGTTSAPLFTTSSTPTSSTSPIVGTTPSTTTTPSPAPSSTTTPSVNEQQDTHRDGRLHIQVDGKQLDPSGKCAYIMRKSFVDRVDPNGYKWVTISEETKQFYWEEFQKKCYWDVEDGAAVEIAWNCMAKEKYRQYIYNMSSRTRNPALQKPSHIEEHVWVAWNAVWNSEEFKMKSEQNKKNRRKGVEGGIAPPTHNGGSASHKQIALDMEECMGRPPSCFDLFMFTHTKNHDGETLHNEKSKKVHDYYESQRAASDALGEDADDSEVFYKAVGGHDSKKRVYGLGSYGSSIFLEKSFNGKCTSPDTNPQHNLKSKIQKLEATVEQQQVELEGMKNTVNDLRSMMEK